jgi:hypothetical protein
LQNSQGIQHIDVSVTRDLLSRVSADQDDGYF